MASTSGIREIFSDIPRCQDKELHQYVVSNEDQQVAFEKLARQPVTGNTLIGTSGLNILNIAALRGIRAATNPETIEQIIVIDRSLLMEHFWGKVEEIITSSDDRETALEKIKSHVTEYRAYYFRNGSEMAPISAVLSQLTQDGLHRKMANDVLSRLIRQVQSGDSCFSSDASFARVKRVFNNNRFLFLRMDFENKTSMDLLARRLQENQMTTDLIYLSNIAEFIEKEDPVQAAPSKRRSYVATLDKLTRPGTLFLQCIPRKCAGCSPHLTLALTRKSVRPLAISDVFPYPDPTILCLSCRSGIGVARLPPEKFTQFLRESKLADVKAAIYMMEPVQIAQIVESRPLDEVAQLIKELDPSYGNILTRALVGKLLATGSERR
ncbi:MAG: hypothetical protein V4492_02885 [Chlamydiota bacterium]